MDVQAVAAALNTFLQAVTTVSAQLQTQPLPQFTNSFMGASGGKAPEVNRKALERIRKKLAKLKAKRASPVNR